MRNSSAVRGDLDKLGDKFILSAGIVLASSQYCETGFNELRHGSLK